jgi:hypothetical protein
VDIGVKVANRVNNTCGKFVAGVSDTGGKLPSVFRIKRTENGTCHLEIRGACGKFKNPPRPPLLRPSSVIFCQNLFNLSHETVPLI